MGIADPLPSPDELAGAARQTDQDVAAYKVSPTDKLLAILRDDVLPFLEAAGAIALPIALKAGEAAAGLAGNPIADAIVAKAGALAAKLAQA